MAVTHHWVSPQFIHTRYHGLVNGEDLLAAAQEIGEDKRFESVRYVIGDWSDIQQADIEADHLRELAAYIIALSKSYPRVMNASVVANYESGVARATFYDILTADSDWQIKTFGSLQEAIDWFGIQQDVSQLVGGER